MSPEFRGSITNYKNSYISSVPKIHFCGHNTAKIKQLTKKGNINFFAANRKRKWETSVCLPQT
jgi:hypothetical protein